MAQQMIYRGTGDGYRIVAISDGLRGKGVAKILTGLSKLPDGPIGMNPVYSRTGLEGGTVLMSTVVDPNGTRNHHISHICFVPAAEKARFAAGILPVDRFAGTYPDRPGVDELPEVFPDASWEETPDLLAARTFFAGQKRLLASFLAGLDELTGPFMTRATKGICVVASDAPGAVSRAAYRLMETLARLVPEWSGVGYRSLWNGADDIARYPVFFTSDELPGSPNSPLISGCALFILKEGRAEMRRGELPTPTKEIESLAGELLDGSAATVKWAAQQVIDAKQQAARQAELARKAREEAAAKAGERSDTARDMMPKAAEPARIRADDKADWNREGRRFFQSVVLPLAEDGRAREGAERIARQSSRMQALRWSERRRYISGCLDEALDRAMRHVRLGQADSSGAVLRMILCLAGENEDLLLRESFFEVHAKGNRDERYLTWRHCLACVNSACRRASSRSESALWWLMMTNAYLGAMDSIADEEVAADIRRFRMMPAATRGEIRAGIGEAGANSAGHVKSRGDSCYWSAMTAAFYADTRFRKDGTLRFAGDCEARCVDAMDSRVRAYFAADIRQLKQHFSQSTVGGRYGTQNLSPLRRGKP